MEISCVLIDDEQMAIDHLLTYIERVPFLKVIACFTDPAKAVAFLEKTSVDVVFMDIEMPNYSLNGMDIVGLIGDRLRYIFTTAYPTYALKSYEYDAIDFLHKPYSFERFLKAVQKARAALICLKNDVLNATETHCFIRQDGKLQRLEYDSIAFIQSERSYLSIYTDNDRVTLQMPIGEIEKQLPDFLFMRVHKSFIIARKRLDFIDTNQIGIARANKLVKIPIGNVYRKAILNAVMPTVLQKK